jgi:hypothetical protein
MERPKCLAAYPVRAIKAGEVLQYFVSARWEFGDLRRSWMGDSGWQKPEGDNEAQWFGKISAFGCKMGSLG